MNVDLLTGLTVIALALAGVIATYVDSAAQTRPHAEVNMRVDTDAVRAGGQACVALRVSLPDIPDRTVVGVLTSDA